MPVKSTAVMYLPRFKKKEAVAQIHIEVCSKYGNSKPKTNFQVDEHDHEVEIYDHQRDDDPDDMYGFLLVFVVLLRARFVI
jgi:hypothetical protein